jgi:hypothetical protein
MSAFIDYSAVKKFIMDKTHDLAVGMEYIERPEGSMDKLSAKGQAIVKYLREHTVDGYYKEMAELLQAITGEPILDKVRQTPGDYPGAAVVPLNGRSGSSYPVDQAFVIATLEQGFLTTGELGNKFNGKKEDLRPATEAEIDTYIERLKASRNVGKFLQAF